jgi:hypothetical protein
MSTYYLLELSVLDDDGWCRALNDKNIMFYKQHTIIKCVQIIAMNTNSRLLTVGLRFI